MAQPRPQEPTKMRSPIIERDLPYATPRRGTILTARILRTPFDNELYEADPLTLTFQGVLRDPNRRYALIGGVRDYGKFMPMSELPEGSNPIARVLITCEPATLKRDAKKNSVEGILLRPLTPGEFRNHPDPLTPNQVLYLIEDVQGAHPSRPLIIYNPSAQKDRKRIEELPTDMQKALLDFIRIGKRLPNLSDRRRRR